ncbi:MAG: hypothetical protein SNG35_08100 [Rikenellaceae bacterium]
MKIKTTLLFLMAMLSLNMAVGKDYSQFVVDKFFSLYSTGIDEKLYLQIDKPYYSAGENIWFKGYLINAITHTSLEHTNYIYVELISSSGELVDRVKVKRGAGGFSGYITTMFDLPAGGYTLRAYTKWMQNKSEELFFQKSIEVVTPIPPQEEGEGATEQSRLAQRAAAKAQKAAEAKSDGKLDYTLQFFPEGGPLLSGVPQNIAFKAVAEDGLSIEVTGAIYDSANNEIGELKSVHKGMGLIFLSAVEGERYYAKVSSSEGLERRFELPVVEREGAALQVARMNNKLFYKVNTNNPDYIKGAYVVIHTRGKIVSIDNGNLIVARSISEDQLFAGVSVVSLVNKDNVVISERIVFKRPNTMPTVEFESDALNYPKRKRAMITAHVSNSDGSPALGEFGVSVVDNKSVEIDPAKGDINSYFLLSSEIAGHVEDPGYYFMDNTADTNRKLDILMLTQGWRRFDLTQVLSEEGVAKGKNLYEKNQTIDGEVKGFFGNSARKPNIFVLSSKINYVDMFQLDQSNKFSLVVNIPDSVTYIVQAQGRGGGKALSLKIRQDEFPVTKPGYYVRIERGQEQQSSVPFAFVNQSQQKFYYEGGTAMLNLDAVYVEASNEEDEEAAFFATKSTTRSELDAMIGLSVETILQSTSGVKYEIDGEEGTVELYYRNNTSPMKFYLDGFETEYSLIYNITSDQIERLDIYDATDAVMFSDSSGGVVQVTLRTDATVSSTDRPNIATVAQLGYQRSATFYQPSYDNPSTVRNAPPDYRTTVYWNGELKSDENGRILFDFFTADSSTDYTIIIEGVTDSGEMCHAETTIKRTLGN